MSRCFSLLRLAALWAALPAPAAHGQEEPPPRSAEGANSQSVRPGDGLLFNGWRVTPAGQQVRTSDLALKMVVSPDGKRLVAVSGGYNDEGLTLIDLAQKRVTQF